MTAPIVRAAVNALDGFGALSQREARTLLGYWARRDKLTDKDVAEVLAHYGDTTGDVLGLMYQRDTEEPTGEPLPEGADGWHVTGRERTDG